MAIDLGSAFAMAPLPPPAEPHLFRPRIAALPGEGVMVAANQPGEAVPNGYPRLIVASYRGRDGDAAAGTVLVSPPAPSERYLGDVATSPSGARAVAWVDYGLYPGSGTTVNLRMVDPSGVPVGEGVHIDVPGEPETVALRGVVALADGGFGLIWNRGGDTSSTAHLQIVSASGEAIAGPVPFGESRVWVGSAMFRAVAAGTDLLVAGETDAGTELWRFGPTGDLSAPPVLLRPTGDLVDLDLLADSDLAATWADGDGVRVGRFDLAGASVAPEVVVAATGDQSALIEPLQDGGFVAAWTRYLGEGYAIGMRAFDRDGAPAGNEAVFASGALLSFDMADLDDGRVAFALDRIVDNLSVVEVATAAVPGSNVPAGGGATATIARWWEQEGIAREDGIDTLVTEDSLALKPFIANLELASTDDLNADGNAMANLMAGNVGDNILLGYLGNDSLAGGDGDDFLAAGRGDDTSVGGTGDDIVWGGQGRDLALGGPGADTLNGDRHDDVLDGGDGDDMLNGGEGCDSAAGADGRDRLTGGRGADMLSGGAGADTLAGDQDDDRLIGGDGADRFVFADASGRDTIADFNFGAGDRMVILAAGGALNGVFVGSAEDLWAHAADVPGGFAVDLGAGNVVLLPGQSAAGLSAGMFEIVT